MKKRTLCMLLISAMLLPLVSCSEKTSEETNDNTPVNNPSEVVTPEDSEETKKYLDDMPETMNFDGYKVRFIVEEGGNGTLSERSIFAEEDAADVVDAAVYNRNLIVSERLNVEIELVDSVMFSGLPGVVRPSINSGADDYDIIGTYQYYGIIMAPEGLMINLDKLQYNDFSREYWATEYMDNMSYKNAKFWSTGDLALRYIGGMYVTYVNAEIASDNYSDVNFYDLVYEGQWTLDKVSELTERGYVDVNGDSKHDAGDQYGFILNIQDPVEGMAAGSNIRLSEVDDDGVPYISIDNERTYTFYDKLYNLVYNNDGFYKAPADDSVSTMKMFASGNALMTVNKLYNSEIYLREMDQDFYILPVPKLDEAQTNYNTRLHDGVTLFGIPVTNQHYDETSATLEAMASESFRLVAPAYYETALKVKYARDNESAKMIDLIRENVSSDFANLYSNSINNIAHLFRTKLDGETQNLSSSMKSNSRVWSKQLEKLFKQLEEKADR